MAYGLRAWTAAGPYPGRLLSPRTEKHTVTTDRFGDRVETKQVADAFAGSAAERIVVDRFGDHLRETAVVDPISGRTHTSRVRSESPRGLRHPWEGAYLDPLYRGRVALDDPLYDPLYRRAALDDPLYRRAALDDPLYRRAALDDPLYRGAALADPLYRRAALDDPLYRRTALADPLLYRRAADPLLCDPLYTDPLYRGAALDDPNWHVAPRNFAGRDPYFRRSAYDDLTLLGRPGRLEGALLSRDFMYDLDRRRAAFRNPLTGALV